MLGKKRERQEITVMSAFNITGEEADPVKSFVFREFREYCSRKKAEEREARDQLSQLRSEERKQRNKAWRQSRARQAREPPQCLDWTSEPSERISREKCCAIL